MVVYLIAKRQMMTSSGSATGREPTIAMVTVILLSLPMCLLAGTGEDLVMTMLIATTPPRDRSSPTATHPKGLRSGHLRSLHHLPPTRGAVSWASLLCWWLVRPPATCWELIGREALMLNSEDDAVGQMIEGQKRSVSVEIIGLRCKDYHYWRMPISPPFAKTQSSHCAYYHFQHVHCEPTSSALLVLIVSGAGQHPQAYN
ncbi:hypothetical protein QBC46DRAFT_388447 [Diplogelasinospora grovesii]|uniref:Uncharacterized protein n=1 Tax=Diplogelasinospora grovesii TaxID=303347 RepID=A0AAN6S413_9PEZI|nr:hypothetical protein QBC46DRAFT_388447 [Diplogelasinospora grovesii]